ncbi:eukaryotic translation initiation factor [Perkinsela sp. CCAP 1560/4]|nr:eukaryotic translation initiation factor [Perkinsela sp. CCAP 1560/4]|eukprot:KNH03769.1 eukaryotic translation initiation factor [Perkinsela sp. CCAP 1560/4]
MLNVDPEQTDVYYRYKMPPLACKVEGRGNGIKTVILNIKEVADSLQRPAEILIKSMGTDLGVAMKLENDRWSLTGDHVKADPLKLQNRLYDFIRRGVLCRYKGCRNPETTYLIEKNKLLMRCKACSAKTEATVNDKVYASIYRLENEALQAEIAANKDRRSKDERQEEKWAESTRMSSSYAQQDLEEPEESAVRRESPVSILRSVVESGVAETVIVDKVFDLKQEFGMQEKDMTKLVFRTYFMAESAPNACMLIRSCAPVLRRFTNRNQMSILMEEAEHYAHSNQAIMFSKYPIFLFELMERGVVNENAVLTWHESVRHRGLQKELCVELRGICEPFMSLIRRFC